ncbi:MAG: glycosyltransferase [Christensenellales bacterium]|jgi:glycosyltransferase involved in cell wall biosynthesis
MRLQVLLSTMNQEDTTILDKMNIESEAVVVNQCGKEGLYKHRHLDKDITFICQDARGVGLSRNTALMRANADICLFSDDDVVYSSGYEKTVIAAFRKYPAADVLIFNVLGDDEQRKDYEITRNHRVRFYNFMRYGAVRIAVRRQSVLNKRIAFSLFFGGGTQFGSGEDSLFLADCLARGLKIFAVKDSLGSVSYETSSWFEGYNEKFLRDKGAFFAALSRPFARLLCMQLIIRHPEMRGKYSFFKAYRFMKKGIGEKRDGRRRRGGGK